jgi:hypothetical protein
VLFQIGDLGKNTQLFIQTCQSGEHTASSATVPANAFPGGGDKVNAVGLPPLADGFAVPVIRAGGLGPRRK